MAEIIEFETQQTTIQVAPGKAFAITAKNNGPANRYIQSVRLNGQPYPNSYLLHKDIVAGGTLELTPRAVGGTRASVVVDRSRP